MKSIKPSNHSVKSTQKLCELLECALDGDFYSMTTTLAKWTINDYHQMIDAGILTNRRVELLAGDIVEMSPEKPIHANK